MRDRYLGRIMQGMTVRDRSGDKLGTVVHAYRYDPTMVSLAGDPSKPPHEELVEIKTGFLGLGKHMFIPLSAVLEVMNSTILLSKSADEVKHSVAWQAKPPYLDSLH